MNKNRYRIVFNKARNLMMAVAENTTSQGKGQQSGSVRSCSCHPNFTEAQLGTKVIELLQLKPIAFAALCMFGLQPVLLHAAVTADANAAASNRPLIETTANGLPLVQITAPSAAGVSRNQYSQFNVDPAGVILNNSQVNVLTQQGGYVNGNANLANGSARIILNEVTGTGPSSLRGYTEVAGQRAEVIIANPNGIVCDGCGFINTSRGILTTGVPVMSGGSLDSFRVTGGQITIGAGGLNASNTDQLDLITRSLQVNGEIWANNLNAVVGANQVDYTTLGVQVIAGDANQPTVRIDVALLGGMYANKIRLVGTEAGVGVNSLGTLAAQAGDFSLDNQGNVTLNGRVSASNTVAIRSSGDITNNGTVEGYTVSTDSVAFTNNGAVLGDAVKIKAVNLTNQGTQAIIAATTSIDLLVSNAVNNLDGATIYSLGDLNASVDGVRDINNGYLLNNMASFTNSSGTVQADGNLRISADLITNKRSVFNVAWTDETTGDYVSGNPRYTPYYRNEYVLETTLPSMLLSGGNMWLKGSINNEYSTIAAGGDINFDVSTFTQPSRELRTEERRDGMWNSNFYVCTAWGLCQYLGSPYNALITTVNSTVNASFTAVGNISGIALTLSNINIGNASSTLGAIQTANTQAASSGIGSLGALPNNGLFHYNTAPNQAYLIETNPRFANYGNFISSDYMLSRLNLDPAQTQKRLGDGFYEQKLVSDQITGLTGRRFLPGYTSAEAEFKALMEQGIAAAHVQNLVPGVVLSTAQLAALTHDIVWMVAQEVHLADGTTEKLLVPQVFLTRLHENDLRPNGSLIAAENINLKTSGTLLNSGTILGSRTNTLNATDIINKGTLSSDGDTVLVASNDIKNLSSTISGVRVAMLAGHDIVNETETEELQLGNVFTTRIHNTATIAATDSIDMQAGHDIGVSGANIVSGGNASMTAGNNLTINTKAASESASAGANGGNSRTTHLTSQVQTGGDLSLQAKNEIKLAAARINAQHQLYVAAKNIKVTAVKDIKQSSFNGSGLVTRNYDEQVIGSSLQAGSDITLVASRKTDSSDEQRSTDDTNVGLAESNGNINLEAATISSQNGNLTLIADADVNISTVDEKHESFSERRSSSSGFFTNTQRTERNETWRTDAIGNSLSGGNVRISSGNDINIAGSDIAASKTLILGAMNDVNIMAATNSYGSEQFSHEETSGWQITSDFNITNKGPEITRKAREDGTKQSYSRSSLTSGDGNLSIMAGGNLIASGTDLDAKAGDIDLTAGGTVALLAGQDTLSQESSSVTITNTNLISQQRRTITDSYDSLTYQGSTVQGNKVTVSSGADIVLQAAQVNAGEGGITLEAGSDIKLLAAMNSTSSKHTEKLETDGVLFGAAGNLDAFSDRGKDSKTEKQHQTAQVSNLKSAADISTHSAHDTLIEASVLDAKEAINLSAGNEATYNHDGSIKTQGTEGNLIFAAVKDTDYLSEEDKHTSRVWQSQSGSGHYTETVKLANISAGGGLSVSATGGIVVDITDVPAPPPVAVLPLEADVAEESYDEHGNPQAKPKLTPEQEVAKAEKAAIKVAEAAAQKKIDDENRFNDHINKLASKPGQEWIGQLAKLAKDKPDSAHLQQVAAAVKQWDYKAEGLTPEAAAVVVIAVTYFSAGAASGAAGTMTGAAVGTTTVASAAVAAGLTALASQAAVTIINNKGDVGKTLDDLSKEEKVRSVVTAMITAGVLQSMNEINYVREINKFNAKSDFTDLLQKNLVNNTASTLVNHAINGGNLEEQLLQSLRTAFIDTGAAKSANWIGDLKDKETLNAYTHKLAHAITGCGVGIAKSDDCRSGALGAVVGELTAELYASNNTGAVFTAKQKADTIGVAKIMSAIAAAVTGNDMNLASAAGGNAAENNYLGHQENQDRLKAERGCLNGEAAACDKKDALDALDTERDEKLKLACQGNSASEGCITVTRDMRNQLATYFKTENGVLSAGLGDYTSKAELQSYVDLIKVSNQQPAGAQSPVMPARSPDYNSDPYGVINPGAADLYMIVKVGDQWGVVGKSDGVYTNIAGVNGIKNQSDYAPGLMGSHVEADQNSKNASLYTLFYNPTEGFLSDSWETLKDKLGFTTPVTKQFSTVLSDVQAANKPVSWVAHSQGGVIFSEAVRYNGSDLSQNSVAFHAGANNQMWTNYILDKSKINSGISTTYLDSPWDPVSNIIGFNTLNPLKLVGSLLAVPLVMWGGSALSPHTLPYQPEITGAPTQPVAP